ncbi:MAG: hypothetical protein J6Y07_04585 [Alphaproteobacteria bacterium]|nr:hypothetical protein [Alphaproteobacteria bacterium]
MSEKFKVDENGTIIFDDRKDEPQTEHDKLMAEYVTLEHDVVNSIAHHTDDPVKVARYHELKEKLGIPDAKDVFKQGENVLTEAEKTERESDNAEFWNLVKNFKNGGKK